MVMTSSLITKIGEDLQTSLALIFVYGSVGEDSTAPSASDTSLGMEVFRDAIDETDITTSDEITSTLIIQPSEANGNTLQEAGIFTTPIYVVDNCDAITGWTDSAAMTVTLNNTTYYEGTGSINLTKDGSGSTEANTSKTVTSQDFTSKTLSLILTFVSDVITNLATTDALKIQYGSDNSNYYEWAYDKADISTGKNFFSDLTSINADTTTGTPVLTAMDYFKIILTTAAAGSTWSAGDVIMDDIKLLSGTMYIRGNIDEFDKTDDIQLYVDYTLKWTVVEE